MINLDSPSEWAHYIGLAEVPLFRDDAPANHKVLLDGGYGSFAISVGDGVEEAAARSTSWIWSGDLPHHVAVSKDRVTVRRWDAAESRSFSRVSIERRLDEFYRYLTVDHRAKARRVVEHSVSLFRRLRSIIPDADRSGASVDAFLLFLAVLMDEPQVTSGALSALAEKSDLPPSSVEALLSAQANALQALISESKSIQIGEQQLVLHPDLAIRHAGGVIFQEAHFDLLRTAPPDLFGYVAEPDIRETTRGGVHFTPPPLARSVVEQVFACLENIEGRSELRICDPACGSGAFLTEALRALKRANFKGKLIVQGFDISQHAVSMARFALGRAARDWRPLGGVELDIRIVDALTGAPFPSSDIIVMNPPFASWSALSPQQREQMRTILGDQLQGRADLSMAFVTKALASLREGGALGTLFPASLLSLQAAGKWRKNLLDEATLRFLAALGDYGLFEYALVQVAAAVFSKGGRAFDTTALWTKDNKATTGDALRALRRSLQGPGRQDASTTDWKIVKIPTGDFASLDTWRIASVTKERLFGEIKKTTQTSVRDLFSVQQGIRTGFNDVFVLSKTQMLALGKGEAKWFRPAIMNESVTAGYLAAPYSVFYPYRNNKLAFVSEVSLKKELPNYHRLYLAPNKARLKGRARFENRHWWELSEHRSWLSHRTVRIVSKYFGERGSFALDKRGDYAVVQGFGWTPKTESLGDSQSEATKIRLLCAYNALFNSRIFEQFLAAFSPQVAGGQFDLSPRYVDQIPLPYLAEDADDVRFEPLVSRLSNLGADVQIFDAAWNDQVDSIVAALYRTDVEAWQRD